MSNVSSGRIGDPFADSSPSTMRSKNSMGWITWTPSIISSRSRWSILSCVEGVFARFTSRRTFCHSIILPPWSVTVPGGGFVGDVLRSFPIVFFSDDPYDFLRFNGPFELAFGSTLNAVRWFVVSWYCRDWWSFFLAKDPADPAVPFETELAAVE